MRIIMVVLGTISALWLCTVCVDAVNAKETTTLEEALERPVVVEKYLDKANNVVCYWIKGNPKYLTCLQRRGLRQHNSDVK